MSIIFPGEPHTGNLRQIDNIVYKYVPADIGYILPYKTEDDPEGKAVRIVPVRGGKDSRWWLFPQQVEFALEMLMEHHNFRYTYEIKSGTESLIDYLTITNDGAVVFHCQGGLLWINLAKLRELRQNEDELFQERFNNMLSMLFA